jgi:hypothetical protein
MATDLDISAGIRADIIRGAPGFRARLTRSEG